MLAIVGACRSADSVAPSAASLAGQYALVTVGDFPVPFRFSTLASGALLADTLALRSDSTFSHTHYYGTYDQPTRPDVTLGSTGTWSVRADTLTLAIDTGGIQPYLVYAVITPRYLTFSTLGTLVTED
ncbi:MAG TPA: hypothetical protein VGD56_19200, partial [Gemmatirosa sp.]